MMFIDLNDLSTGCLQHDPFSRYKLIGKTLILKYHLGKLRMKPVVSNAEMSNDLSQHITNSKQLVDYELEAKLEMLKTTYDRLMVDIRIK